MTESLLDRRHRLLGSAYRLFYDEPLHLVRGEGAWLFDADGRRYLDAYNNVPHVGHCRSEVVEAIARQAAQLNTHTRYLHENVLDYAENLTGRLPGGLAVAMFSCSGTEANELALRIAREVTGNVGMICTRYAYHGTSWAISQISPEDVPADALEDNIAPFDITADDPMASLEAAIDRLAQHGHRPAVLIVDTILSSEGLPELPEGFLAAAANRVRSAGGLFVADEVQAGFGRTGERFWGFERHGAMPDIVTMGKPMGNGHPISCTVTRRDLVERFTRRYHYFNTFAGNPVSCAAAQAVLDVMDKDGLQGNALSTGQYLRDRLADMAIGALRGSGLFIGLELPDGEAERIKNALRVHGVLTGTTGPDNRVLKIRPPLVFGREHADHLLDVLGRQI